MGKLNDSVSQLRAVVEGMEKTRAIKKNLALRGSVPFKTTGPASGTKAPIKPASAATTVASQANKPSISGATADKSNPLNKMII